MRLSAKLCAEFVGTFFLCLSIALNENAGVANLIAIGALLTGLIYAGGPISAAHYNPAVTFGFFLRKKIEAKEAIFYILIQLLAALLAALLSSEMLGASGDGSGAIGSAGMKAAITAEIIGSFALVFVILNVATSPRTAGNEYYGVAIGFTVVGLGYVLGTYSGAAFNPAVVISQSIAGFFAWSHLLMYMLSIFAGAILATICFNLMNLSGD